MNPIYNMSINGNFNKKDIWDALDDIMEISFKEKQKIVATAATEATFDGNTDFVFCLMDYYDKHQQTLPFIEDVYIAACVSTNFPILERILDCYATKDEDFIREGFLTMCEMHRKSVISFYFKQNLVTEHMLYEGILEAAESGSGTIVPLLFSDLPPWNFDGGLCVALEHNNIEYVKAIIQLPNAPYFVQKVDGNIFKKPNAAVEFFVDYLKTNHLDFVKNIAKQFTNNLIEEKNFEALECFYDIFKEHLPKKISADILPPKLSAHFLKNMMPADKQLKKHKKF